MSDDRDEGDDADERSSSSPPSQAREDTDDRSPSSPPSQAREDADDQSPSSPPSQAREDAAGEESGEDADELLDRAGFDPETSVLTRRQAEVLALREEGLSQAAIADRLGTSRANVSGVEASARENVRKARETVAFAETLRAPVQVRVAAGTDLYDVPDEVYDACDAAGVKVVHAAPDLMQVISDAAGEAVEGRQVVADILVGVTGDGDVRVRVPDEE